MNVYTNSGPSRPIEYPQRTPAVIGLAIYGDRASSDRPCGCYLRQPDGDAGALELSDCKKKGVNSVPQELSSMHIEYANR